MAATDVTIDSFIQNSMAFLRKNKFDGIDIDWQYPAFCENPERCSPPGDAERFKVLLEKFRSAIESENVSPQNKMLISSSGGHKKTQIYKTNDDTRTTSVPLQGAAAMISNETTTFSPPSNSTEISASDLKVEIWAPVLAVILLAVIILILWRVKRVNARVTNNSVRSDRKARDPDVDTVYENYGSSDNCNNIQHEQSYYSKPYTAYDAGYAEYGDHYAEYKKPKKGFRQPFQAIF